MAKIASAAVLKLVWAIYLMATSLYCLLAFLPYTYYALIKAPVYEWMPLFARYHALLYWSALVAGAVGYRPATRKLAYRLGLTTAALCGVALSLHPILPAIQSDAAAFIFALAALLLLIFSAMPVIAETWPQGPLDQPWSGYAGPMLAAVLICLLALLGTRLRFQQQQSIAAHSGTPGLWFWSLITHVVLAVLVVTLGNMLSLAAGKTQFPRQVRYALILLAAFVFICLGCSSFLQNALSAARLPADLYAAALAASLCAVAASLVRPIAARAESSSASSSTSRSLVLTGVISVFSVCALLAPSMIGGWDWNGIFQAVFTLVLWAGLGYAVCVLLPRSRAYSWPALAGVLLVTLFSYKALQASEFLWSRSLGVTQEDISQSMEAYAGNDASFRLASHMLGEGLRQQECGELCRILREYTNIRHATVQNQIQLVDHLTTASGTPPNIFILVIDSMRPDYLGAYNPKVDFTPNIDAFARDSVVFRNGFTQYAGTTLSEPAIWSGVLLLHSHYVQPFAKVNSLASLLKVDGYQNVVSYDTVLQQLLAPSDDLVKLDTDKPLWNQFELGSTVEQLARFLDTRANPGRPLFFYSQPMNVHVFAHNKLPTARDENWRRAGFNPRISIEVHQVDEALGRFVACLKSHQLYDNSIIIIASDHGDATGEFGRNLHSTIIYPEIMRVPLIVHLPKSMQGKFVYDVDAVSTLTDITPSLYYLLGHGPVRHNPLFGRPLFTRTGEELASYDRNEIFLASDERAAYGILMDKGRFLYTTYDAPAESMLFDLLRDPFAQHNIITPELKSRYDRRVIDDLKMIADFYGYKPRIDSLFAADHHFH